MLLESGQLHRTICAVGQAAGSDHRCSCLQQVAKASQQSGKYLQTANVQTAYAKLTQEINSINITAGALPAQQQIWHPLLDSAVSNTVVLLLLEFVKPGLSFERSGMCRGGTSDNH